MDAAAFDEPDRSKGADQACVDRKIRAIGPQLVGRSREGSSREREVRPAVYPGRPPCKPHIVIGKLASHLAPAVLHFY